jgi:hypothetical protein
MVVAAWQAVHSTLSAQPKQTMSPAVATRL